MKRLTIEVGSFEVNCSVMSKDGLAYIVDPGQDADLILSMTVKQGLIPSAVLLTHAHFDHISALPKLQTAFPDLPVYVHPADVPMFGHPFNQMLEEYRSIGVPKNIRNVEELPSILPEVKVIHTPGHTPGGVCYYFEDDKLLLSGDTLFAGSIGRTDFPGGSMTQLSNSLKKLAALPEETLVIPGHGIYTTIGDEKQGNPYLI